MLDATLFDAGLNLTFEQDHLVGHGNFTSNLPLLVFDCTDSRR